MVKFFCVDGPRGTGKTFHYRALISRLRSVRQIVLATASSGIAATLLPGGQTAHSRFKIPLNPDSSSVCSISKQSDLAKLITKTSAIVWDEAPMVNRYALEAVDRTLRDIIGCDAPFGGKVVILGGDFRQVLPVIPKGNNAEMIAACIVNSPLWAYTNVLHLRQNMHSLQDQSFVEYLMRIGDGVEPTIRDDLEDFNNVNLDPSGEDDQDDTQEPYAATQGESSGHASQEPTSLPGCYGTTSQQ
ncbi:PREDICTED: uncharacterized protein LOC109329317 [Lupinus angustifolius]|uniref:uncharacterized protein LOC109329317 n=1 Tax=Lupinus angustifolius TaxID=3871 RepID=UPI00092F6DAE|nr:PREDICTED: uncharacterized protein LOC109329317 [Lupinus angustifolius]